MSAECAGVSASVLPGEAGSGFDALAFDGAVDRGAADAEESGDFKGALLAAVHRGGQVCFLATVELGMPAAQSAFGHGGALDQLLDTPQEPTRPDRTTITALSEEAIDQSRKWLTSAWTDMPELKKWAPDDPLFTTLKNQALSDVFHEHHNKDIT